jgi:phosphoglycolate phosphatase
VHKNPGQEKIPALLFYPPMNKISLIIFDLDGTLIDAYPAIISSFNYAMKKSGYPSQDDTVIRRSVGWGDENLLKPFINKKDLNKAVAAYRRHHRHALVKDSRPFSKARSVLALLKKRGYALAVASNRPTEFSRILLRHLKLEKYFDYVLCADKLKYGKPHPQILKRIMRHFSVKPSETLYVGDMTIDVQAGRRAKVRVIAVTTGSSTAGELKRERPYRIIAGIEDLLKLF